MVVAISETEGTYGYLARERHQRDVEYTTRAAF
jgi:hypothetical protein